MVAGDPERRAVGVQDAGVGDQFHAGTLGGIDHRPMLHGALAELHSADARHRPEVAASLARLFLRGDVVPGRASRSAAPTDGVIPRPPEAPHTEDEA